MAAPCGQVPPASWCPSAGVSSEPPWLGAPRAPPLPSHTPFWAIVSEYTSPLAKTLQRTSGGRPHWRSPLHQTVMASRRSSARMQAQVHGLPRRLEGCSPCSHMSLASWAGPVLLRPTTGISPFHTVPASLDPPPPAPQLYPPLLHPVLPGHTGCGPGKGELVTGTVPSSQGQTVAPWGGLG